MMITISVMGLLIFSNQFTGLIKIINSTVSFDPPVPYPKALKACEKLVIFVIFEGVG